MILDIGNFDLYAQKICRKFNQESFNIENNSYNYIPIDSAALPEEDFNVFGFIDGSITKPVTVGTGPNGNYKGAMRKNEADELQ